MSRQAARMLFWTPRVLSILFALFLGLFALDALSEGQTIWQRAGAFLMNLTPSALVLVILVLAWRWEWTGALLYTAAAALYAVMVLPAHISWALIIASPALVIAALFLMNWVKRTELRTR